RTTIRGEEHELVTLKTVALRFPLTSQTRFDLQVMLGRPSTPLSTDKPGGSGNRRWMGSRPRG
ncbi:hypothetical protein ABG768_018530, partial [Culter alburnus]